MVGLFEFFLPLLLVAGFVLWVIYRHNQHRPKLIVIDPLDFIEEYYFARFVGSEREIGELTVLLKESHLEPNQPITSLINAITKSRPTRVPKNIVTLQDWPLEPLGITRSMTSGSKTRIMSVGSVNAILSQTNTSTAENIGQEVITAHRHGFLTIGFASKFSHSQSFLDQAPRDLTFVGYAIFELKWNQVLLDHLQTALRNGSKLACVSRLPKEFLEFFWEKQQWSPVQFINEAKLNHLSLVNRDKLLTDIPAIAEATEETRYYAMKEWGQTYQCHEFAGRPYQESTDSVK